MSTHSTSTSQSTELVGVKHHRSSETHSDSDLGPPPPKRQKLTEPLALLVARVIREGLAILCVMKRLFPMEFLQNDSEFDFVNRWIEHAQAVHTSVSPMPRTYAEEFPPFLPDQPVFEKTCIKYKQELKNFMTRPPSLSPSSYAKGSAWIDYQAREDCRVLCFRPESARGIALHLLHDVFREFREIWLNQARDSIEEPDLLDAAEPVVAQLISTMLDSFRTHPIYGKPDAQMKRAFWDIITPFLGFYSQEYPLGTGSSSAKVDGVWFIEDSSAQHHHLLALLELKAEIGSSGDPYMRLVRTYQLAIDELKLEDTHAAEVILAEGAPMFLIGLVGAIVSWKSAIAAIYGFSLVIGTNFFVSGGFYDGKHTLVEHLAQILLVDDGFGTAHQDNLARLFYALAKTMCPLRVRMNQVLSAREPPPPFTPLTPRLYNSWTPFSDGEPNFVVTFLEPLLPLTSRCHIFSAILADLHVLVKLAAMHYGATVHELLAKERLAPRLLAYATPDHLPAAYAMEYLSDWQVLEKASTSDCTEEMVSCVRQRLKRVLDCLEENQMVHGDLRPANILFKFVEEQQRVDIRVIDFDWAGEAGRVTYPSRLNPNIAWPGKSRDPIEQDHDLIMVKNWWPTRFPGSKFTDD